VVWALLRIVACAPADAVGGFCGAGFLDSHAREGSEQAPRQRERGPIDIRIAPGRPRA
jgi:hypothetical protein